MTGGSASSGRRPRTRSMRVRISSIASLRSWPQVKFSWTLAAAFVRVRVHLLETRDRAQLLLERPRDELLHLERADARVVDADADRRLRDVGQQVDRQAGQRDAAEQDDDAADHRHHDGPFNRKARDAHTNSSVCRSVARPCHGRDALSHAVQARPRRVPVLRSPSAAGPALAAAPGRRLTAAAASVAAAAASRRRHRTVPRPLRVAPGRGARCDRPRAARRRRSSRRFAFGQAGRRLRPAADRSARLRSA